MTPHEQVRDRPATPEAAPAGEPPTDRLLVWAALALCALIVLDRARLLHTFGFRYTDEDQSLLWTTAADLRHFHVRAPYFYGQAYGSWLEALVAAPLAAVGVAYRYALPLSGLVMGAAGPLLLVATAWRRRAHVVALAVLAGFLLMNTRGALISAMPRGLMPGIFLASLGAAIALNWGPRPWAVGAFGLLAIVGAGFNESALLIGAPCGAYVVLSHRRDRRVWVAAAAGAAAGVLFHVAAKGFYASHPGYDFHPVWKFDFQVTLLRAALRRYGAYFGDYGPGIVPLALVPVAVLAVLLVVVAWRRGLAGAAAGAVAVLFLAVALGTPKATDGTTSIFFSYSRAFLAFPALLAFLAVVAVGSVGRRARLGPEGRRVVAAGLVAVSAVGFLYREATANREISRLIREVAEHPVSAAVVPEVLDLCHDTARIARDSGTNLVVYRVDRLSAYACGAVLDGRVTTMFPLYDRRTWVLRHEEVTPRTSVLVADADAEFCGSARLYVTSCAVADERLHLVLLRFPAQPVLPLLRFLGEEVRPL